MDDLRAILDQLGPRELDYVTARSHTDSDAAALRKAGIAKSTFHSKFSADRRAELNDIALQLRRRVKVRALLVLEEKAEDAARNLVALMESDDDRVALNAANSVLDRTTGKPTTRIEHDGQINTGTVAIYLPDNGRDAAPSDGGDDDAPLDNDDD